MSFRDFPLSRKLIVIGIAASTVALVLTSTVFLVTTYVMVQRAVHADVVAQAAIVADNSTAALAFGDRAAATETLQALRAKGNIEFACLYDMSDQLFSQFDVIITLTIIDQPDCPIFIRHGLVARAKVNDCQPGVPQAVGARPGGETRNR